MSIDRIQQSGRIQPANSGEKTAPAQFKGVSKDSISISDKAKIQAEMQHALELVKQAPDIRADKVEIARQNLQSWFDGDMIKPDVLKTISGRLSRDLGL